MAFNVSSFRSEMKYDGARPNLFECKLDSLNILGAGGLGGGVVPSSGSQTKFTFMCRAAQLPGSTINSVPVNYFGRELKFAGNRTFAEWTVTIINDEDFLVRNTMEQWMSRINSHVGNSRDTNLMSPLSYTADAEVIQYAKNEETTDISSGSTLGKTYKFRGLFPIDISPIELDWGANDTIEEFAVTFAYQWWESNTTDKENS